MRVFDLDLGFLSNLAAAHELGRPLRREHAARSPVEDAKPQRGVACRFARSVEAVVLLVVLSLELRPALAQQRAQPGMIARAGDAELQLAFDAAITGAVMRSAPCHGGRLSEIHLRTHGRYTFRQL